jgi:single-stranded DNA-binding protein
VSVWGKPAEWIGELRKGDAVTVMGEAYMREHNGTTYMGVRAQSVIAHERKERGASAGASSAASGGKPQQQRKPQSNAGGGWGGGRDDDHGF